MNAELTSAAGLSETGSTTSKRLDRFFYSGAAALLLIFTFIGFQHFYLAGHNSDGQDLDPARRGKLIAHGIAMSLWMLIFMAQPLLIVTGNRKAHKTLGWAGAIVALCTVVLGLSLVFPLPPNDPNGGLFYGLRSRQFSGLIFFLILVFASCVFVGVWNRKRPAVHRPMMLLSVLTVVGAAFDRIPWIFTIYFKSFWGLTFGPAFGPIVVGLFLLGLKRVLTRSWDKWFGIGLAALAGVNALIMVFVKSSGWDVIANSLSR